LPTTIGDVIGLAKCQRLDGPCQLAGHAEVPSDTVDRPRPQADARQAVILKVNPSISFVAAFEDAIMRSGTQKHVINHGTRIIILRRPKNGCRASIDQSLNLLP